MARKYILSLCLLPILFSDSGKRMMAQEGQGHIHVVVDMVQLNVAVTDKKGNYFTGLRPQDFTVLEDGITEKVATFAEGNEPAKRVMDLTAHPKAASTVANQAPATSASVVDAQSLSSLVAGANVFLLFDTSNYMYRGFVFAQDAITGFVRSMQNADKIAFYSYSRDLSRATPLTTDREAVLRGVRNSVAGDKAALYNCLLLTVKDAAQLHGRKAIVVFSNGPDDASSVPPEDV